ncbi:transglycosylase SLT domain-containing protein [Spongiactinospora sp. TRM90649]|uniref:aggregation-promoting factor C-terminal-like domain-containing protein n=1 Tax=Spongiactinospora sp. TRM90649 TaxID=3031114 RepID=UPI0023F93A8E|nr:transglycosylase SLT domain-containing protein [Spongiactinospora sp. TRM90649]MDF5754740.1 transglycosylase SLT domain-containing protein [Spongiactinospora sp. TRM90649]
MSSGPELRDRPAPQGTRGRRRSSQRSTRGLPPRAAAPADPRPPKSRRGSWSTSKRILILGSTAVFIVGGGGFVAYTAYQNANRPPSEPVPLAEWAKLLGPDPFAPDPQADIQKAAAAQSMRKRALEDSRKGRDPLSRVKIPEKAPGGDGFLPKNFPVGTKPNTGSNMAIGKAMNAAMGWDSQWGCLQSLWQKESNWNERAMNRYSGAYGIPQSLPGSKMASAGSDWQTNPATQIKWGLGYIKGRYGSPCGAWGHSQRVGWY